MFVQSSLVAVRETGHAAHDSQYVVTESKNKEFSVGGDVQLESVVLSETISEVQVEDGAVDSGQVGSTRRLVLLGVESKAVHVDTISRGSGVVVLSLVVVEVASFLDLESVVTVELDVGALDGVTLTIESETVVVGLNDTDILVDTVLVGVAGSVVDSEIFNRDRQVSQVESVSDLNSFNRDGLFGTISVGDNNSGKVDHVRQFNSVVVTQQREVDRAEESVVAPDIDTGFVDIIKALSVGEFSDVVVSEFNNNSLSIVVTLVSAVGAEVSRLTVDLGSLSRKLGVDEDATFSQVLGSVVHSSSGPGVVIVGVAEELTATSREGRLVTLTVEGTDLKSPDELLGRMVVVQLELLVVGSRVGVDLNSLLTRELDLLNKVLVTKLSVLTSLTGFKVDVVNHDTSILEREVAHVGGGLTGPAHKLANFLELEIDSDFVVLKSDQRQSKTVVSAEPELEGDVESVLREQDLRGSVKEFLSTKGSHLFNITDQSSVTSLFGLSVSQFVEDIEPDTDVVVDSHTTDLDLNFLDEGVSESSDPSNLLSRSTENFGSNSRDSNSEGSLGSKITISLNLDGVSAAWLG